MNELERSLLVLLYEKYKNSKKETGSNIITRRTLSKSSKAAIRS